MKIIIAFFSLMFICRVIAAEAVQLPIATDNKEFPFQNMDAVWPEQLR